MVVVDYNWIYGCEAISMQSCTYINNSTKSLYKSTLIKSCRNMVNSTMQVILLIVLSVVCCIDCIPLMINGDEGWLPLYYYTLTSIISSCRLSHNQYSIWCIKPILGIGFQPKSVPRKAYKKWSFFHNNFSSRTWSWYQPVHVWSGIP